MTATRQGSTHPGQAERSRAPRRELTEDGRRRLRAAALRHQPWRFSPGPRTPEGKAQAVRNGKTRQLGVISTREARAQLAGVRDLLRRMRECRELAVPRGDG
jgi:hypothetical protein